MVKLEHLFATEHRKLSVFKLELNNKQSNILENVLVKRNNDDVRQRNLTQINRRFASMVDRMIMIDDYLIYMYKGQILSANKDGSNLSYRSPVMLLTKVGIYF